MTNKTIPALTAATVPLIGTELIPLWDGATKKVTLNDVIGLSRPYTSTGIVYADTTTTLTTNANFGYDGTTFSVNIAPSPWATGTAFQAPGGNLWFRSGGNGVSFNQNMAFYSAAYRYLENDFASRYLQIGGEHYWYSATSGTVGNAITFTQAMKLDLNYNFIPNAGKGINFTANTPAAGMTSQLLNWYEEGTYTATITSTTGTYTATAQSLYFTRIGNVVTVSGGITIVTNGTAGGSLNFTLPYPAKAYDSVNFGGREAQSTGIVFGGVSTAVNLVRIAKYDGTYLGADGYRFPLGFSYICA